MQTTDYDNLQNEISVTPTTANSSWFLKVIDARFPQGHRRRLRQFTILNFLLTLLGIVPTGIGGTIPQGTDVVTGVTLNKLRGRITTQSYGTAANDFKDFVLTNSTIAAADIIALSITYTGTGNPIPLVREVAAGSCKIRIHNASSSVMNATMVINFAVIKGASA